MVFQNLFKKSLFIYSSYSIYIDIIIGKGIVVSELVPLPEFVKNLPGRVSQATHELVFLASQLPPLGSRSFHVSTSFMRGKSSKTRSELNDEPKNGTSATTDRIISNEVKY